MSQEIEDLKALLTAFIDAVGYDVTELPLIGSGGDTGYKVTKRPKPAAVPRGTPKSDYTDDFEAVWSTYPKRIGNNSKSDAFRAYNARLKGAKSLTNEHELMMSGVNRYSDFLDATGNKDTEFVMMASTFLGPSKNYMQEWKKPAVRADVIKLPTMDDDLSKFAADNGLTEARAGEKYPEYRKRLSSELSILNSGE